MKFLLKFLKINCVGKKPKKALKKLPRPSPKRLFNLIYTAKAETSCYVEVFFFLSERGDQLFFQAPRMTNFDVFNKLAL